MLVDWVAVLVDLFSSNRLTWCILRHCNLDSGGSVGENSVSEVRGGAN